MGIAFQGIDFDNECVRARMVLTLNPLCRAFGLSGRWISGEDCLSAESASSAAAQMRR